MAVSSNIYRHTLITTPQYYTLGFCAANNSLPRFGALRHSRVTAKKLPNHADWKKLMMQSCTRTDLPCALQTSAYKVMKHFLMSERYTPVLTMANFLILAK